MSSTILQRDFGVHSQGQSCPARLLLTSFRQQRHFTHYTYRILLWVPIVVSAECVESLKHITVSLSQEVYERDFRSVVRHDFVFRIEDIEVYQTLDPNIRSQPTLPSFYYNDNQAAAGSSSETRHLHSGAPPSSSLSSHRDSQNSVRQSYIMAQRSKVVSFTQIPREVTLSSLGVSRWDPFELQPHQFRRAHLDEEKINRMHTLIRLAISKLPIASDWTVFARRHSLEAPSVHSLIVDAFRSNAAAIPNPVKTTTAEFGCGILERSQHLRSRNPRAAKLAKLIGCAVMCISEYLDGGFKHGAGILNDKMGRAVNEVPGVQKRSRNLVRYFCWMTSQVTGWGGRSIALYFILDSMGQGRLYELFSVTCPAFAAEMAKLLSRPEYRSPTTEILPDILEIVKYLLRGTVEDQTICDALGCSLEALSSSSTPSTISSQDWLLESLQRVARPDELCAQDLACIPDSDSIQNRSFLANSPVRSELFEENQSISVHEEICQTREERIKQHNTHEDSLEYDWDNGPLELFPWELMETDYAFDRGPYSSGAFSLDESDPMLG